MPLVEDLGICRIEMYFRDHNPPHVHVVAGGERARLAIGDGSLLDGVIRRSVFRAAREWVLANADVLAELWTEYSRRD